MGIGSILVGIALLLVVVAYLARPFRVAGASPGLDRAIETWVALMRAQGDGGRRGRGAEEQGAERQGSVRPIVPSAAAASAPTTASAPGAARR